MAVYFVCFILTLLLLKVANITSIWTRSKHFVLLANDCYGVLRDRELDDEKKEYRLKANLWQIAQSWCVVACFIFGCVVVVMGFGLIFGLGIDALSNILLIASSFLAAFAYAIWIRLNAR